MKSPKEPLITGTIVMILAVFVDQVTKAWVVANADTLSSGFAVFPGFNLVFGRNDGVSFGLLRGMPSWSLAILALIICVWLFSLMMRAEHRIEALAYGLVIGGALGNVVDRVRFGAVTDFLDLYVGSMHWPAFNLADAILVSGFAILWLAGHRQPNRSKRRTSE